MAQRAIPRASSTLKAALDKSALRMRIIEEHYLRREIAREEAFRRENPDLWSRADAARVTRNQSQTELNRKLRAARCAPVAMELSLKQKMKKLQQLEARNRAETASIKRSA